MQLVFVYLPLIYVLLRFVLWLKYVCSEDPDQQQQQQNEHNQIHHGSVDLEEERERERRLVVNRLNDLSSNEYNPRPDEE